jgi:hypothetical protein
MQMAFIKNYTMFLCKPITGFHKNMAQAKKDTSAQVFIATAIRDDYYEMRNWKKFKKDIHA